MNVLESFRANTLKAQELPNASDLFRIPRPLEYLFIDLLNDKNTTQEDIMNLLKLLCNEESKDYDSITHYFL